MGKHKVDMGSYDESSAGAGYAGQEPPRGFYRGVMVAVDDHEAKSSGNEGLQWKFEIKAGGPYDGWRGYVYSDFANSLWKTQQICHAITGNPDKDVTIDTDDSGAKMAKRAKPVMIRVVQEKYEGEMRSKIKTIAPVVEEDGDENEDGEDPFA